MKRELIEVAPNMVVEKTSIPTQELLDLLDHCKMLRETGQTHSPAGFPLLGLIHPFHIEQYCNERGVLFAEFMQNADHQKALLKRPDMRGFRVAYNGE